MRSSVSRRLPLLVAVAVAGSAALAACGGGGATTGGPVGPPGVACPALALNGPPLVSPAPGATGVPTTVTVLTFGPIGFGIADTVTGNATLSGSDSSTLTSGTLTRSSDGTTTAASIAGLQPHTTYTVKVSGIVIERACSFPFSANDGSFTTQ